MFSLTSQLSLHVSVAPVGLLSELHVAQIFQKIQTSIVITRVKRSSRSSIRAPRGMIFRKFKFFIFATRVNRSSRSSLRAPRGTNFSKIQISNF